jgi:PHD/YefM family antitoxin component YafN of YafNO toxin-antitoxin module
VPENQLLLCFIDMWINFYIIQVSQNYVDLLVTHTVVRHCVIINSQDFELIAQTLYDSSMALFLAS